MHASRDPYFHSSDLGGGGHSHIIILDNPPIPDFPPLPPFLTSSEQHSYTYTQLHTITHNYTPPSDLVTSRVTPQHPAEPCPALTSVRRLRPAAAPFVSSIPVRHWRGRRGIRRVVGGGGGVGAFDGFHSGRFDPGVREWCEGWCDGWIGGGGCLSVDAPRPFRTR